MNTYFVILLISLHLKPVFNDCGLPAIPTNAKINDFSSHYLENTQIEYYCELPELELLDGKTRVCKNGQWIGSIPRCAEEIGSNSINRFEIIDSSGKLENKTSIKGLNGVNGKAFYGDFSKGECVSAKGGSLKPVTFRIILSKNYLHISSFELIIHTGKEFNSTKEILDIFTNKLRTCIPTIKQNATAPAYILLLNVICDLETTSDLDTYYSYYSTDVTTNITLKFDSSTISLCQVRLFYRKANRFHYCGSPDIPLHSEVDFIRLGSRFGLMPYYRYSCDKNFHLVGKLEVRCGINNYWLDEFPTCSPSITCSVPPERDAQSVTVEMNSYDLFEYNQTLTAIPGSKFIYNCEKRQNLTQNIMIGDSVRVCTETGQWSGIEPYCIDLNELKLEKYSQILEQKIPNEIDFPIKPNNENNDCGLPGLPVFAKPTPGSLGPSADFRFSYPNGTKISYSCESAFHWMFPSITSRTCIKGQWIGEIGKCEINYSGKVVLTSILVSSYDSSKIISQWISPTANSTVGDSGLANSFGTNQCVHMNVTEKQKWSLRLNDSQKISGFILTLRPAGLYGENLSPKMLANMTRKPIRAKIGRSFCKIAYAYDYPKLQTSIIFRCDGDRSRDYSSHTNGVNEIVFYVNPQRFEPKFNSTNLSICSLYIFHSSDNCGVPDKPLHSIVKIENQIAMYSCEDGYQLNGLKSVPCLPNGKWADPFPNCVIKKNLCPKQKNMKSLGLDFNYLNSYNGSIVSSTIIRYKCLNISSFKGRALLVGSRTRLCQTNGQWSGSMPFCIDSDKYQPLLEPKNQTKHSIIVTAVTLTSLFAIIAIITCLYMLCKKGYIKSPTILLKNSSSSSLPVRPESKVSICDMNATLEQLSALQSIKRSDVMTNNNKTNSDSNACNNSNFLEVKQN